METQEIMAFYVVAVRFRWTGNYRAWNRIRRRIRRFLEKNRLEWVETTWEPDQDRKGNRVGLRVVER